MPPVTPTPAPVPSPRRLRAAGQGLALLLLIALLAPLVPTASAEPMLHRERIIDALTRPVSESTKTQWMHIGPPRETNDILVSLVQGRGVPRVYALRAMEVLAFFPTKQSKQVLWQIVYDRETDDLRRKVALRSLGAGWQGEVLFDVAGFLDDPSAVLREGAVMGLGLIDDPRVTSILENRLYQEDSIQVRLAVEKALDQSRRLDVERARAQAHELLPQTPRTLPDNLEPKLPR